MTEKKSIRSRVQRFGSNLSSMIMPNIGAFIAFGTITAINAFFFIQILDNMVVPMIYYLLPLLIAYTGGKLVHDMRGGVVGATAVMGVIAAVPDAPMFIGAMIMGPLGGYAIKKFDQLVDGKIRQGFEMLVNNFSAGLIGAALAVIGSLLVAPIVKGLTSALGAGADFLISTGLLPLVSIIIEPAKILFLNNAINHGVLVPLAATQFDTLGKSIFYLLEANPGPGLGILLAFMIFGKGVARGSAYGAGIIHFIGGIHEIYFPYVLMKPLMFLAVIFGGASGVFVFNLFQVGLVAPASPGSIIPIMALTAQGDYLGVILGVLVATVVSFVIASLILRFDKKGEEDNIEEAQAKMQDMKGKKSSVVSTSGSKTGNGYENVSSIIFACDAGMGSSAMGASIMKDRVKKAGIEGVSVSNTSISNIPDSADLVITHKDLTERAKQKNPSAIHVSVDNFMNSPRYNEIIEDLKGGQSIEEPVSSEATKEEVDKIIFACDAGMGSSAMGASLLKNKFKKANIEGIHISNTAINSIPSDADIVITHKDLTERAKQKQPNAEHISVENFMNSPKYDELIERLK
ncbi:PTS mannitol-specific transporter subunit IIBC [Shouchella hunanensis]|uniref:PTS system mannitol-specific EIICB component n=1 Tax=Shouchella hunanensis TaxID=766894 RepID=A0ABY7WCE6_9BACI|nr:PTS mannitol-specific transporter subunit IIBC [Shouchella hunanensis]WDF04335.1 PTS mannitol-specific transporter subunit IIBC [Shouchella hunanensis]